MMSFLLVIVLHNKNNFLEEVKSQLAQLDVVAWVCLFQASFYLVEEYLYPSLPKIPWEARAEVEIEAYEVRDELRVCNLWFALPEDNP